jgi:hypothetical protein
MAKANETQTGFCASAATGIWSEGYYDDTCARYGLVTILKNPDRLILQVKDQDGVTHVSYTVLSDTPTPTPTPTLTPQPPLITKQPVNQKVNVGETATFSSQPPERPL